MHAMKLHTLRHRVKRDSKRAGHAVGWIWGGAKLADKTLARNPQQNRATKTVKQRNAAQQG